MSDETKGVTYLAPGIKIQPFEPQNRALLNRLVSFVSRELGRPVDMKTAVMLAVADYLRDRDD